MSGDASSAPMSHRQFGAVVHRIAWTYLEVERGLRPGHHLAKFLTRDECLRHRGLARKPVPGEWGPVRPTDIGKIRLRRAAPDQVEAVVMARRDEGRWGALIIDLERPDARWQVRTLGRLEQLPQQQLHRPVDLPNPAEVRFRRRLVEGERRDAAAARDAIAARIDEIGDRRTKPARVLRPQLEFWSEHVLVLDDELATLRRHERQQQRRNASEQLYASQDHGSDGVLAVGDDGAGLSPATQSLWQRVDRDVREYRERWSMSEDQPIVGTRLDNEIQAAERRTLVNSLLSTARREGGLHRDGVGETQLQTAAVGQQR